MKDVFHRSVSLPYFLLGALISLPLVLSCIIFLMTAGDWLHAWDYGFGLFVLLSVFFSILLLGVIEYTLRRYFLQVLCPVFSCVLLVSLLAFPIFLRAGSKFATLVPSWHIKFLNISWTIPEVESVSINGTASLRLQFVSENKSPEYEYDYAGLMWIGTNKSRVSLGIDLSSMQARPWIEGRLQEQVAFNSETCHAMLMKMGIPRDASTTITEEILLLIEAAKLAESFPDISGTIPKIQYRAHARQRLILSGMFWGITLIVLFGLTGRLSLGAVGSVKRGGGVSTIDSAEKPFALNVTDFFLIVNPAFF